MPKHIIHLIITLSAFWLLLSGYYDKINLLILGILSVVLVIFLSLRMKVYEHKNQPLYFPFFSLLYYWFWLFKEIFKSNLTVALMILNPKLPIKPLLKIVHAKQQTEIGRVIYANSITLTPGTVAINVSLNRGIIVHALHKDSITELGQGQMHDHVMALEKYIFTRPINENKNAAKSDSNVDSKNTEAKQ